MRPRRLLPIVALLSLLGACGTDGAKKYDGESSEAVQLYGSCAFCHGALANHMIDTGGHKNLAFTCDLCHDENLTPGEFGPGHRNVPACTDCHGGQMTHPPAEVASNQQECAVCHTPHGSTNLFLVRTLLQVPSGAIQNVVFDNEEGRADGSFASASNPGTGVCEICHDTTRYYRSDGMGEAHFTTTCTFCHEHANGFLPPDTPTPTSTPLPAMATPTPAPPTATPATPVDTPTPGAPTPTPTQLFGVCADCHPDKAESLIENGGHGNAEFQCEACHTEALGPPGPGHRSIPACTDCHSEQMTHEPAEVASDEQECAVCHTPHGSPNLYLVKTMITVPSGATRDVVFDNEAGKADGSFASASAPGTGLCEICHDTTEFYRSDGTGAPHLEITCTNCHTHARGFLPR